MTAAPSPIQTRHLHHLHLLCIVHRTQRMTGTKTDCRHVDHLHLRSIEAVELPEMIRHRIDVEEDVVHQNLLRVDRINDPDHPTETKIEIGIEIVHENIPEETDRDLDREEDHVPEIEGVVVVVIEVEIDIEAEKAVDTIEHHRTNQILLKIITILAYRNQLFLYNLMLLKTMVALWKCSKRCRNKCSLRKNRRLLFWKRKLLFLHH